MKKKKKKAKIVRYSPGEVDRRKVCLAAFIRSYEIQWSHKTTLSSQCFKIKEVCFNCVLPITNRLQHPGVKTKADGGAPVWRTSSCHGKGKEMG